jgi:hypothetical protein
MRCHPSNLFRPSVQDKKAIHEQYLCREPALDSKGRRTIGQHRRELAHFGLTRDGCSADGVSQMLHYCALML